MGDSNEPSCDELVVRYEKLRTHILERRTGGSRLGLALFLREGMAAWLTALLAYSSPLTTTRASSSSRAKSDPAANEFPDDVLPAIVNIVTNIALHNIVEMNR